MKPVEISAALRSRLARLSARERRLLTLAVAVVCAGALLSVAEWAVTQRTQLAHKLPAARAQLMQMQEEAAELTRLRQSSPPPAATLATRAEGARAAARRRDLALAVETADHGLQFSGEAPVEALLDWLASMHEEQRLRVAKLSLLPKGGLLKVEGQLHFMGDN